LLGELASFQHFVVSESANNPRERSNNAHKQKNSSEEEELEPPSPSKPAYENTACLQKKRINE
jgi:hypothetical protein